MLKTVRESNEVLKTVRESNEVLKTVRESNDRGTEDSKRE